MTRRTKSVIGYPGCALVGVVAVAAGLLGTTTRAQAAPVAQMQVARQLPPQSTESRFAVPPRTAAVTATGSPTADSIRSITTRADTATLPADSNSQLLRRALNNGLHYALKTWYPQTFGKQSSAQYLALGGVDEAHVKGVAMEAYGLAAAVRTGGYDPAVTGVAASQAQSVAVRLISSLAARHVANARGGWGNGWQTGVWAADTASAAWLLWGQLSATDRSHVIAMLRYEANRFLTYQVPYYQDPSGRVLTPGDSKAEENAWNATVVELAAYLLPNDPNVPAWRQKGAELLISSYARPQDVQSTDLVNGIALNQWLHGSNALADGTVINHGIVHSDYVASATMKLDVPIYAALAGDSAPAAALLNLPDTYASLSQAQFSSPPFRAPGGSMYVAGSSNLYYPQGNDWGTARRSNMAGFDVLAAAFGLDTGMNATASSWATLHLQAQLALQARSSDGRTYQTPTEDTYLLREQMVVRDLTDAWLGTWAVANAMVHVTDAPIAGAAPASSTVSGGYVATALPNRRVQLSGPSGVRDLGGTATSVPSVTVGPGGRVFVVVRGSDGRMWERTPTTAWTAIARTASCADPTARASGSTLYVACRGAHHELEAGSATISSSGHPYVNTWKNLGGYLAAGPSIVLDESAGARRIGYAVVGHDYAMRTSKANSYLWTPTGWLRLGLTCAGKLASTPAVPSAGAPWVACATPTGTVAVQQLASASTYAGSSSGLTPGGFDVALRASGPVGLSASADGSSAVLYVPAANGQLTSLSVSPTGVSPVTSARARVGNGLSATAVS